MRTKLKKLRDKWNLTQQKVADEVGIDRSYYAHIENGDSNPSLKIALKIKEVLGTERDDIFFNYREHNMHAKKGKRLNS